MTNPQLPQWLVDAIKDVYLPDTSITPEKVAALITARFEQACGEDDTRPSKIDPNYEYDCGLEDGRNLLRYEMRRTWYAGEGDKNERD